MRIVKTTSKIPAGLMIAPLSMRVLINTFCPRVLQIGSSTTATFSNTGTVSFMGVQLLDIGTMLRLGDMPQVLKRGGVLLLSKFLAGVVVGLTTNAIFGDKGLFELTASALISTITDNNGSIYTALVTIYGDKTDYAAVSMLVFSDGPFLTLVALGVSGLVDIPLIPLAAVLVPLMVGMIPDSLDEDCNKFSTPLVGLTILFVGLALGGSINLMNTMRSGLPGVILGLLAMYIASPFTAFYDRKIPKRSGYIGLAVSTIAGNSVATPATVALTDPAWQSYVTETTAQIAAAMVATTIVIPIATSARVKWLGSPKNPMNGHTDEVWQNRKQTGVGRGQTNERRKDMYDALTIEKNDNVAVVLEVTYVGDKAIYRCDDEERSAVSLSEVPACHRVAVRDIKRGDRTLKHGKKLGVVTQDIKLGEHVHVQNLDGEQEGS